MLDENIKNSSPTYPEIEILFDCFEKPPVKITLPGEAIWNIDVTIAQLVSPLIKLYKEKEHGLPDELTEEQYDEILDKIIAAFDLIKDDCATCNEGDNERIQEGLELFAKYLRYFWT